MTASDEEIIEHSIHLYAHLRRPVPELQLLVGAGADAAALADAAARDGAGRGAAARPPRVPAQAHRRRAAAAGPRALRHAPLQLQ